MTVIMTAATPLASSRRMPSTPAEWLAAGIILVVMVVVIAVLARWMNRRFDEQSEAGVAWQTQASAVFRARWPGDRVWQAGYAELEAEVQGCWQLVLTLESRNAERQGPTAAEGDRQINAVRAYISTLLGPLNAAAAREHRVVG
ncbi:hypothetical protein [Mycolicibacterium sediminis]|nr:hypothetical protein [Mycolicibacterium sediminis]